MTPSSVLLFAAGLGTRMAPLTNTMPKPMVQVAGKPLLEHAIGQCDGLRVVVNVHYLADQIERYVDGRDIVVSDETDVLLETGGGLKHALPLLKSNPVFTMNTDAVWRGANPIQTLTDAWSDDMDALLLMIPRDAAVGHTGQGDFNIGTDGQLTRGIDYVYSGVQIIKTDGLGQIPEATFSMWSLWTDMLARGTMHGVTYDGQWCDVGRPDSIPIAEAMLSGAHDV
jgi:MurNAc alpha-1-phosphate uridylyltransferase